MTVTPYTKCVDGIPTWPAIGGNRAGLTLSTVADRLRSKRAAACVRVVHEASCARPHRERGKGV